MDPLIDLKNRLKQAMLETEREIEDRQKAIKSQLKTVQKEKSKISAERQHLDDERLSIEHQQADLDSKLAELSSLRTEFVPPKRGWCCSAKSEKLNELDVTGDMTLARVDALEALKAYGAGSDDVNGMYFKVHDQDGEMYFRKADDGKCIYYYIGAGFGLPDAWYIADVYRGAAMYWCRSADDRTVPFAGWEIFDNENFSNPGIHPPPLLEVGA